MTDDGGVLGINGLVGFAVVEHAAEPPAPSADSTPVIGLPLSVGTVRTEGGAQAGLPAFGEVGLDVAIVGGGHRVALLEDHSQRPAAALGAARGLGGVVIDDAFVLGLAHPACGQGDVGFFGDGVVAAKAEAAEHRRGFGEAIGNVEHHIHARPLRVLAEGDVDELARGQSAQGIGLGGGDFHLHIAGHCRGVPVHVFSKQLEDLGAALGGPLLGAGDLGAIGIDQQWRQGDGTHLGFIVVGFAVGIGKGGGAEGEGQWKKAEWIHAESMIRSGKGSQCREKSGPVALQLEWLHRWRRNRATLPLGKTGPAGTIRRARTRLLTHLRNSRRAHGDVARPEGSEPLD